MTQPKLGTLALVGSGEYTDAMNETDRLLIERVGGAGAAVVIMATASAPDGREVMANWERMGSAHFRALGAAVQVAPIVDRADADNPAYAALIAQARLVYLSGGKPDYLLHTLRDSASWRAMQQIYAQGGVLVGCSAGAMALAGKQLAVSFRLGPPWHWTDALGLVPNVVLLPHYDRLRHGPFSLLLHAVPPEYVTVGVDEDTAMISDGAGWLVSGRSGVEVRHAGVVVTYGTGERFQLPGGSL